MTYARKVNALSELRKDNPAEYNREVWRLQELFLRRCTTFMNDTLFVRNVRTKKPLTEGGAYEPKP